MSNATRTPIDPHAINEAEHAVQALSGTQGKRVYFSVSTTNVLGHLPNVITVQMIEMAKNRIHILRGTREFYRPTTTATATTSTATTTTSTTAGN